MQCITDVLSTAMGAAFAACGYEKELGTVRTSDRWDLCQFQCSGAFAAAKRYRKNPMEIAAAVAQRFCCEDRVEKLEAVPPGFLNLTLRDSCWLGLGAALEEDAFCGIPQAEEAETILLDYGNPNVAKPLHVGHLRSAIIGEALKRLVQATGRSAIGDVHLGDWGTPMGLVLAGLQEQYETMPPLTADLLNTVYPLASKKSREDPAFLEKARKITADLQQGNPAYTALWKQLVAVSTEDMAKTFARLGVRFDCWKGESDADAAVPALLARLREKGILRESQGALVVDVQTQTDKAPVPPVIIQKSDRASIYATTDLATLIQRVEEFAPKQIWYVVDHRQSLHFTQVFRCARKGGLVPEHTALVHIGFGTMNGKDGKPYKTRDGGVMKLSDLLDTAAKAASERIKEFPGGEAFKRQTAEKLAIAAVKFGDLCNHYSKDTVFDLEKFLAPEGKTGVYLLYTVTRLNSILRKAEAADCAGLQGIYTEAQRELLIKLVLSGGVLQRAYEEQAPNLVCENAYQIAAAFSRFYHETHILSEQDKARKNTWIALCKLTGKLLCKHLDLLGIEPVAYM